jgi:hypothetical protein
MAFALMPALTRAAPAVTRQLPSLVAKAKQFAPEAYQKLAQLSGLSSTTPERIASQAAASGNTMVAQALINNAVKSGLPLVLIRTTIPVLDATDVAYLEAQYADITNVERQASNVGAVEVKGPADMVIAHLVTEVEKVCKYLALTSDQLVDVVTFFRTHGADDIKRYQKMKLAMRQRPV